MLGRFLAKLAEKTKSTTEQSETVQSLQTGFCPKVTKDWSLVISEVAQLFSFE